MFNDTDSGAAVQHVLKSTIAAALLLGYWLAGPMPAALAAAHDGNWTVLVTTEKGTCDRGYRYNVTVANGLVRYQGEASVSLNGTVAPNGAVKVNISSSGQGAATGTGRLSANAGAGTWSGKGSAGECSGRWDAERR